MPLNGGTLVVKGAISVQFLRPSPAVRCSRCVYEERKRPRRPEHANLKRCGAQIKIAVRGSASSVTAEPSSLMVPADHNLRNSGDLQMKLLTRGTRAIPLPMMRQEVRATARNQ